MEVCVGLLICDRHIGPRDIPGVSDYGVKHLVSVILQANLIWCTSIQWLLRFHLYGFRTYWRDKLYSNVLHMMLKQSTRQPILTKLKYQQKQKQTKMDLIITHHLNNPKSQTFKYLVTRLPTCVEAGSQLNWNLWQITPAHPYLMSIAHTQNWTTGGCTKLWQDNINEFPFQFIAEIMLAVCLS